MLEFSEVKRQASGQWLNILQAQGVPSEILTGKHTPCPGCGGKDRFRFVPSDPDGKFFCGQGGSPTGGDGFSLLRHVFGWQPYEALQAVASYLGIQPDVSPQARQKAKQRALLAKAAPLEAALLHEIIVLHIVLNSRATDRQLDRDYKHKAKHPEFQPLPPGHWEREETAARRIFSLIQKLYPASVLKVAA